MQRFLSKFNGTSGALSLRIGASQKRPGGSPPGRRQGILAFSFFYEMYPTIRVGAYSTAALSSTMIPESVSRSVPFITNRL